jgi:two-component system, OmpR family, alkaline phosphatase synthesis response regulator PhoP
MGKFILLSDDEIHILRAAEYKLKEAGYDVEITLDGEEAWQAILSRKPDLLIADYFMPRLNGVDLIRRIRGNPSTADIPVFILTCKIYLLSPEALKEELNVLQVIDKPFSPRALLKEVDDLLSEVKQKV